MNRDDPFRDAPVWRHDGTAEPMHCPVHPDLEMFYWPAGDDHACQDPECVYAHGLGAAAQDAP